MTVTTLRYLFATSWLPCDRSERVVAVPGEGEVTYVWSSGADEVSMYTAYGRAMPGHCSIYFGADQEAARA